MSNILVEADLGVRENLRPRGVRLRKNSRPKTKRLIAGLLWQIRDIVIVKSEFSYHLNGLAELLDKNF